MSLENNNPTESNKTTASVDQAQVDVILADKELVEKILREKGISEKLELGVNGSGNNVANEKKSAINKEAAYGMALVLVFFILGIFIASPLFQLFQRIIRDITDFEWSAGLNPNIDFFYFNNMYHDMIRTISILVYVAAGFLYLYWLFRIILEWKNIWNKIPSMLLKLLPFLIFLLFDVGILLVTKVRGPNEYDLTGHPYMGESIYSYILYPISYFFCGMMLYQAKRKKVLLYALVFTSFPIHILALLVEYGVHFSYFAQYNHVYPGWNVVAVFHNANHYGYYIAFVLMVSALLFVYETKPALKVFLMISVCLCSLMIVINNTLGAFLATGFVLTIFFLYRLFDNKKKGTLGKGFFKQLTMSGSWQSALFILILYVLITLALNIHYRTIIDSLIKLFSDSGDIIKDPSMAGNAGSGRWALWKATVKYIPEHPFVGFGVEGLLNAHHVGTPHNEFLQYAAFFGIPVAVLYTAACTIALARVWINRAKMSPMTMVCFFTAIGYLVNSLFGVAIYYTTPFLFIFLGLAYSECVREDDSAKG